MSEFEFLKFQIMKIGPHPLIWDKGERYLVTLIWMQMKFFVFNYK